MISISRYTKDNLDVWNNFIESSKNATFLFNRNYMDYHSDRFNDYSLMIFDDNALLAVLPANQIDNETICSHSGLTYGGIVLGSTIRLNDYLKVMYAILDYLHLNNITRVFLKPLPDFYSTLPSQEYNYAMFHLKAIKYRVDTTLTIHQLNKIDLQTRRKRSIKKGLKGNFTIKRDNNFKTFWNEILTPNLQERFGKKPVHTVDEIELLASRFPNNIFQVNIYTENKIVGGATMFVTQEVAHAQYISASNLGRNSGALDLLFDRLINEYYADKMYFDFGICNENEGKYINHGLLDWKEGFGGRTYVHEFYKLSTTNKSELLNVIMTPH